MPDLLHKLVKLLDHNRWTVLGALLALTPILAAGCGLLEGRVESSLTGQRSTAVEIRARAEADLRKIQSAIRQYQSEISLLVAQSEGLASDANAEIELANAATDRKIAAAQTLLTLARESPLLAASGGAAVLLPLLSAAGLALDNRRKDKVISTLKEPQG